MLKDVEPYLKRPKLELKAKCIETFQPSQQKLQNFRFIDLIWALSFINQVPRTPMWAGFNAIVCNDLSPLQKVAYLPQINMGPTSYATVQHTLKMAQEIAQECEELILAQELICTYDLAIAKMALAIQ